ncbi:sigma-70 family RNA polymerase sigma factor [Thiohalorhabdus methylotrophus]
MRVLLHACADGDRSALARLYRTAGPKLYGLALRILREESRAQECLQEAFIRIWEHAGSYREARGAPMTWMGIIVRRRALDMLRGPGRERLLADPEDLENLLDDPDRHGGAEGYAKGREDLAKCLEELGEEQRKALHLAFFEGLTHPELAERLQQPLGTVKTWIRRALLQLRNCLER